MEELNARIASWPSTSYNAGIGVSCRDIRTHTRTHTNSLSLSLYIYIYLDHGAMLAQHEFHLCAYKGDYLGKGSCADNRWCCLIRDG